MTKRYHCLKCGDLTGQNFWDRRTGEHVGCGGRIIPIATICDPPEPTVIDRLLRWLGIEPIDVEIIYDEPDMVTVPLEQWHRVFERVRKAEARVVELERQLAAMEQSDVPCVDPHWLKVWEIVRDLRAGGMTMDDIAAHLKDHGLSLPRIT